MDDLSSLSGSGKHYYLDYVDKDSHNFVYKDGGSDTRLIIACSESEDGYGLIIDDITVEPISYEFSLSRNIDSEGNETISLIDLSTGNPASVDYFSNLVASSDKVIKLAIDLGQDDETGTDLGILASFADKMNTFEIITREDPLYGDQVLYSNPGEN